MTPIREGRAWPAAYLVLDSLWLAAAVLVIDSLLPHPAGTQVLLLVALLWPAFAAGRLWPARRNWKRIGAALVLGAGISFLSVWGLSPARLPAPGDGFWTPWTTGFTVLLICAAFIWFRGWTMGDSRPGPSGLIREFQIGLTVLTGACVLTALVPGPARAVQFLGATFLVLSLAGLTWSRLFTGGRRPDRKSQPGWALASLLPAILAAGLAAAVYLIVDRDFLEALLVPLTWLWEQFLHLLDYLFGGKEYTPYDMPAMPGLPQGPPPDQVRPLFDISWLRTLGHIFFAGGSGFLVLGAAYRILADLIRWLRLKAANPPGLAVVPLEDGFWDDLWVLFLALRSWVRSAAARLWSLATGRRKSFSQGDPAVAYYRRLLRRGAGLGLPRQPHQTPDEYLTVLVERAPDADDQLRFLTQNYLRSRYGLEPTRPEDGPRLKTDWRILRKHLKKRWLKAETP